MLRRRGVAADSQVRTAAATAASTAPPARRQTRCSVEAVSQPVAVPTAAATTAAARRHLGAPSTRCRRRLGLVRLGLEDPLPLLPLPVNRPAHVKERDARRRPRRCTFAGSPRLVLVLLTHNHFCK